MEQKQITSLDYSPLIGSFTTEMREQYYAKHPQNMKHEKTIIIVYIFLFILGLYMSLSGTTENHINRLIPLLIVGIFIVFSNYVWNKHKNHLMRIQSFADKNGLVYKPYVSNPAYSGMIFNEGHSRLLKDVMVLPQYEIGNYEYVTGSGKYSQTHSFGYMKLNLKRPIPHIVLDSKKNNLFGKISNLPVSFKQSQSFELEGDFSKYFTLYAPEDYERDALYILTPDVMSVLVDGSAQYDLEAIGSELYLYQMHDFNLKSQSTYEKTMEQVQSLNAELVDQASGYLDDRVAFDESAVSVKGTRLRTGLSRNFIYFGLLVIGSVMIITISII